MAKILCLVGLIILPLEALAQTAGVPPVVIPPTAPSICTTTCSGSSCTTVCF